MNADPLGDFTKLAGTPRIVALDFESTGKPIPTLEQMARQPKGWRPPGAIIQIGAVEMLREGSGWRKGRTYETLVNPDAPLDPRSAQVHKISYADLKRAPRYREVAEAFATFLCGAPIVAHAYLNERSYLNYEHARAGLCAWGEEVQLPDNWFCTQVAFAGLFPGAPKSLDAACDRLWVDRSDRFEKHGALLDADLTADVFSKMLEMDGRGDR